MSPRIVPLAGVPTGPRPGASVAMYFLGGTISMPDADGGAVPHLDAAELLATVPQIKDLDVQLDVLQLRQLPGPSLTSGDIAELVVLAAEAHADGVVVVQGTDTLEETAYLLDLLWVADHPIVVTGAMRTPTAAGADGPANILDAITVAACPAFRGFGALVVFDGEVHAARYVQKMHTTRTRAFCSPAAGPLGVLAEGRAVRLLGITRNPVYPIPSPARWPRVPLIGVGFDDDGEVARGLASRCDGAVLLALGGGHVPPVLLPALSELAGNVPVVLASRTVAGPVLASTYGYPGSERDLLERGLIRAGLLDAYKARVLLRVLLALGASRAEICSAFNAADVSIDAVRARSGGRQ